MAEQFIEIVKFAQDLLVKQPCPYCKLHFKLTDVTAQGNRRAPNGLSYYYYETFCSGCSQPSMTVVTSRPMNTRGLLKALGEYYEEVDAAKGSSYLANDDEANVVQEEEPKEPAKPEASKISDEEVAKLRHLLEVSETYEDVLKGLGISESQLRDFMEEGKQKDDLSGDGKSK